MMKLKSQLLTLSLFAGMVAPLQATSESEVEKQPKEATYILIDKNGYAVPISAEDARELNQRGVKGVYLLSSNNGEKNPGQLSQKEAESSDKEVVENHSAQEKTALMSDVKKHHTEQKGASPVEEKTENGVYRSTYFENYETAKANVYSALNLLISDSNLPLLQRFATKGWSEEGFTELIDTLNGATSEQKETMMFLKPAFKDMMENPEMREVLKEGYTESDKLKEALLISMAISVLGTIGIGVASKTVFDMGGASLPFHTYAFAAISLGISSFMAGTCFLPKTLENRFSNVPSIQQVIDNRAVSMASENGNMIQSEKGSQSEAGAVKVAQSQSRLPIVANQLQHVR